MTEKPFAFGNVIKTTQDGLCNSLHKILSGWLDVYLNTHHWELVKSGRSDGAWHGKVEDLPLWKVMCYEFWPYPSLCYLEIVVGMKTTKSTRFFNQDENKGKLSFEFRLWNKKNKNKTWHVQNTNPRRFYCKEETKTKQGWKKNVPKTIVE